VRELSAEEFRGIVDKKDIALSSHAFDHMSTTQRKVFKEDDLKELLWRTAPRRVHLQQNGNYAAYYRTNEGYRKVIVVIDKDKVIIVTYMDTPEIPRARIENGDTKTP